MTANKPSTGKRGGKRSTSWKKGQSGNPNGRPKDGESWSAIIKSVGDMYPDDIIAFIGADNILGKTIKQLPKNVQMKYLVISRVFAALMFEPSHSLLKELIDRVDGKVPEQMNHTGSLKVDGLTDVLRQVYASKPNDTSIP